MFVVLIGAPGAGKGTHAADLSSAFALTHLASGDMFRDVIARKTLRGRQAKAYMDRGELVPDELTVGMVIERLSQPDYSSGAILDGFPRTLAQARALDEALARQRGMVDLGLYLSVPGDELLRRLSGRWLCRQCQTPYHNVFNPPKAPGTCDRCGGELYQRSDDAIETARRRLEVYFEQTTPVIDYYRERGVLEEVDGARSIADVRASAIEAVGRHRQAI
jgi:adenylate kinase